MKGVVREVPVTLPHPALPDSDWADAYQVDVPNPFDNARQATEAVLKAFPIWTYPAFALRQILVLPFGLKGGARGPTKKDVVGIFPVRGESPTELVAGFDDKHLDFRIVIDLEANGSNQQLTLTTVIRRHNLVGRTYLQMVMPFHRMIIRSALATVVDRQG